MIVPVTAEVSIRLTVAVDDHVCHTASINSKVKLPFHVNVYISNQLLLVIVIHVLLNHVNIATTFPFVAVAGVYSTLAVGVVVSIRSTVAVVLQVFPAKSVNVNSKLQFQVNKYSDAFNHVTASLNHVNVAITLPLVNVHEAGT